MCCEFVEGRIKRNIIHPLASQLLKEAALQIFCSRSLLEYLYVVDITVYLFVADIMCSHLLWKAQSARVLSMTLHIEQTLYKVGHSAGLRGNNGRRSYQWLSNLTAC